MKYALFFILMLGLGRFAFADDQKNHDHSQMEKSEKMTCELKDGEACTVIAVPTAQCGMCEKTIGSALEGVKGVTLAKVDVKAKTAHVHYTSADVQVSDLEKAIAAVGYDANKVTRNEDAHSKLPDCCKSER